MKMKEELKFLQIDTSNEDSLLIRLYLGENESQINILEKRCHLEKLVPSIGEILKQNNLKIVDLDFIALNEGPGSWTGLRIGFSTIKTISQINDIKLILYSNFDIIREKHKENTGVFLVPTNNSRFYYFVLFNNDPIQLGVVSQKDLSEFYPDIPRFYYENNLNCKNLLISKYNAGEFQDVMKIEPFYLAEGVILD